MRKVLGLIFILSFTFGVGFEYPVLYESPRVLGMGGVDLAIGGLPFSLFSNPAGLSRMDRGFTVYLLNPSLEISSDAVRFIQDVENIQNSQNKEIQLVDLIKSYRGKVFRLGFSDFSFVGFRGVRFSFGFGALGLFRADGVLHQGFTSEGILETELNLFYGAIGGFAINFGNLKVGFGLKNVKRHGFFKKYYASDFLNPSFNVSKKLKEVFSDSSFDFGLIYQFEELPLEPSFGLSITNISDLNLGEFVIPQTINLGFALRPHLPLVKETTLGLDLIDLTKRLGNDTDLGKRTRFGVELKIWDNWFSTFILRAGIMNANYTAGLEFRLALFTIGFSTYAEEVGAYAGQDSSRRYSLFATLGW